MVLSSKIADNNLSLEISKRPRRRLKALVSDKGKIPPRERRKERREAMEYTYQDQMMTRADLAAGILAGLLNQGRELVSMVPHVMENIDGKTYVVAYWVVWREPK